MALYQLDKIPYVEKWKKAINLEQNTNLKYAWKRAITVEIISTELSQNKYLIYFKLLIRNIPNWVRKGNYISICKKESDSKVLEGEIITINYSKKECVIVLRHKLRKLQILSNQEHFWLIPYSSTPYKLMWKGVKQCFYETDSLLSKKLLTQEKISTNNLKVVQGPPGTGKTTTIAKICKKLYQKFELEYKKNLKEKKTEEIPRFLITAFTHKACVNLAEKMDEEKIPFVCVDIKGLPPHLKNKYALSHLVEQAIITKNKISKKNITNLSTDLGRQLLEQTMFIINTSMSATQKFKINENPFFKYAIADEGSQMPIPILAGISTIAKKLYVYGDPKQLPPVILSPIIEEKDQKKENPLKFTIFDKISERKIQLLEHQFRGRPEFFLLISALFYEGKVKTGNFIPKICDYPTIEFLDTSKLNPLENNRINRTEAKICQYLLDSFTGIKKSMRNLKVGIITPFRTQASYLKKHISTPSPNIDLDIGTVHVTQGRTYDYVIFSLAANSLSPFLNPLESTLKRIHENLFLIFQRLWDETSRMQKIQYPDYKNNLHLVYQKWEDFFSNYQYQEENKKASLHLQIFDDKELDFTLDLDNFEILPQNEFANNIFNVALSRAKNNVSIIGNYQVLRKNPLVYLIYEWIRVFGEIKIIEENRR